MKGTKQAATGAIERHDRTFQRAKLSVADEEVSDSSATSTVSRLEHAALSSTLSERTNADTNTDVDDSDLSSELSESSEEPSSGSELSDDEHDQTVPGASKSHTPTNPVRAVRFAADPVKGGEDDIIDVLGRPKPRIGNTEEPFEDTTKDLPHLSLQERLQAFRRMMEEQPPDSMPAEGNLKDVEEGEQYIEMDLGLGVLEEKDPNAPSDSSDSEYDSDYKYKVAHSDGVANDSKAMKEENIMCRLKGERGTKPKPGIQVLAEEDPS